MEARVRIELTYNGFADHSLTTWVPRLKLDYTQKFYTQKLYPNRLNRA